MMEDNVTGFHPLNFQDEEKEIAKALSVLKKHGLNIRLPAELQKRLSSTILFDGDDGLFKELIDDVDVYFEYGCGKSTEYTYYYSNAKIFSVDTSRVWATRVSAIDTARINVTWVDVGEVRKWGYPISYRMRHNFKVYAETLWQTENKPELVLIDGRFRVFCFLTTVMNAPLGTKVLFDDYTNRPAYHIVEEVSPILETCGRQALFEVSAESKNRTTSAMASSFQNVME